MTDFIPVIIVFLICAWVFVDKKRKTAQHPHATEISRARAVLNTLTSQRASRDQINEARRVLRNWEEAPDPLRDRKVDCVLEELRELTGVLRAMNDSNEQAHVDPPLGALRTLVPINS